MSVRLSDNLDLIATAPAGIQKMHGLIYEIAARGMLDGDIALPARSVKLGEVAEFVMGQAPPGTECNTNGVGMIFVKTGEFGEPFPVVREWTTKPLKFAKRGDVLICVVGATVGKLNLAIDCAIGRSVAAIRPCSDLETRYLHTALVPFTLRLREQSRGSAQGVIGKSELGQVQIRLPPLAEQHRIVAKVDELMALCDRLEAEQTDAGAAHARLVDTLLGTLTQSTDAAELAANWQRLAKHFDTLFTTEASLDALKQTILQLAVMGKLVPQDPNQEPVIRRLGESVDFLNGYAFKSEWFVKSGVRLLRNANVAHGRCDWKDAAYLPQERQNEFKKFALEVGDLVLSLDRPIINTGLKIARITESDMPCLILQRVAKVSPFPGAVDMDYLYLWFNSPQFMGAINPGRSNGIPHISTKQVGDLPFVRYSLREQHRIVAKVDELMALVDRLKANLADSRARQERLAATLIESALQAA